MGARAALLEPGGSAAGDSVLMKDTRPVECRFFDAEDKLVGTVTLPPRREGEALRQVVFGRRTFVEGDGTGFYGENEFAEVVQEESCTKG